MEAKVHIAFIQCVESHALFNGRTELKDGHSHRTMVQVSEDVRVSFMGITIIRNNTVLDQSGVLTNSNGASYSFIGQAIFHGNRGIALVRPELIIHLICLLFKYFIHKFHPYYSRICPYYSK